jgi:hypothetical protein
MFSRRHQLFYFISAVQHHYKARLLMMEFPYLTRQIFELVCCLQQEKLIAGFFIKKTNTNNWPYRTIVIYFYYINNNDLLFSSFKPTGPRVYLTQSKLAFWIKKKASYLFPILFIQTPTHGILTDRQLAYLQLTGKTTSYLGGRLIAQLF